jgi:hypothetical protein
VLNIANGFFLPTLRRAGVPTAVNVDGIEWQRDKWGRVGKGVFRRGAVLTARHATDGCYHRAPCWPVSTSVKTPTSIEWR